MMFNEFKYYIQTSLRHTQFPVNERMKTEMVVGQCVSAHRELFIAMLSIIIIENIRKYTAVSLW